jgi:hypothetical protein
MLTQRIYDKMEKDGRKALQLPISPTVFKKICTKEYDWFMKMRQTDKYRYGTPKDKKVSEGKIPFIITKTGTNITEKLAKEIMQEYENQSYK